MSKNMLLTLCIIPLLTGIALRAYEKSVEHKEVFVPYAYEPKRFGIDTGTEMTKSSSSGPYFEKLKQIVDQSLAGLQYHKQGELKQAEACYLAAAEQGDKPAQYNLGLIYHELGQVEKAKHFYKLVAESGKYPQAQNNLGTLFYEQGDPEMAEYYWKIAAGNTIQPHSSGMIIYQNPIAEYNLGMFFDKQGNLDKAEHYYKIAARFLDTDSIANLLAMYYSHNKPEKARALSKLIPSHGFYMSNKLNNVGQLYEKYGDLETARHFYSLAANQNYPEAKEHLKRLKGVSLLKLPVDITVITSGIAAASLIALVNHVWQQQRALRG